MITYILRKALLLSFVVILTAGHTSVFAGGSKTITRGEPVDIAWAVTKVNACEPTTSYDPAAGDGVYLTWINSAGVGSSGITSLPPVYNIGTFTFTCSYSLTSKSDTATLTVVDCPYGKIWSNNQCRLILKMGTLTYSASNGPDVDYGETALLSWSGIEQATSCSLNGGSFSNVNVGIANTGTRVTASLTGDTTYTLTCQGPGGPISKSVTVPVAAGTISASPTVCVIPVGFSTCSTNITWMTNNMSSPRVTDKNGVVLSTNSSGSNIPFTVPYGNSQFSIKNGAVSHDSVTVNASCSSGNTWNGAVCVGPSSGSISINPTSCIIPIGQNTCPASLTWTSTGLTSPSVEKGGVTMSTSANGTNISTSVTFGTTNFVLKDTSNNTTYDSANITTTCQPGSTWNGSVCFASVSFINSSSCIIPSGQSGCQTTVSWNVNNPASSSVTVTRAYDSNSVFATGDSGNQNTTFPNGTWQLDLRDGNNVVASGNFTASCEPGTTWNGSSCLPPAKSGSISLNPVSCIIPSGLSSCVTNLTWNSSGLNSPVVLQGSTLLSTNPSGANLPAYVPFGNTTFSLKDGTQGALIDSVIMAATCEFGSSWNGHVCLGASGTINSASCIIPTGESGCSMSVTWNATDATSPITVTRAYDGDSIFASGNTGNQNAVFPNGAWKLDLRHGSSIIASGNFSTSCENGSLWNGSICALSGVSGDLQVSSNECLIPVGSNSCPVSATWTTLGTSDPSLINQFGSILSRLAQRISSFPVTVSYPSTTFTLREGAIPLDQEKVTARCSLGAWSNATGECVNPLVVSAVVIGQYYANPGTITLTCSASNSYRVEKEGVLFASGGYNLLPVSISVTNSGNYSITCIKNDVSSAPVVRYYSSGPPPSPTVILNASPRTIPRDSNTTLTWSILHPDNSCNLEARTICPKTGCSQDQIAAKNLINQKIATENIEQGSIFESSRSIRDSLRKIPTSRVNIDWKTVGSKKFDMKYSTEFAITCAGGVSQAVRIQVTTTGEQ